MKQCIWCGRKFQDGLDVCPVDGKPLSDDDERVTASSAPSPVTDDAVAAKETQYWEQMDFRRFAVLMVRLQALWLLLYAVVEATDLLPYFRSVAVGPDFADLASDFKFGFFLLVLRIAIQVAAAVALIQNAERLLGWLVKDWVRELPAKPLISAPGDGGADSARSRRG